MLRNVRAVLMTVGLCAAFASGAKAQIVKSPPEPAVPAPKEDGKARPVRQFTGHTSIVSAVAIAPDGKSGVSASHDGTVRVWDLKDFRAHAVLNKLRKQLYAVAYSPDGQNLTAGGVEGLFLLRADNGKFLRSFEGVKGWVHAVAFTGNGKTLLSAGGNTVQLWDIASGTQVKSVSHEMDVTKSARLTADGKKVLVVGGYYNNSKTPQSYYVRLWDITSGQESFRLEYPKRTAFQGAVLVANDTRIVTVGPEGSLREWDVTTGKERRVWADGNGITCLATSADGRYVVTAGYLKEVRLWDVDTGRIVDSYLVPDLVADSIALSRDARRVLIGSRDGSVFSFEFTGLPKQAVSEPPAK